MDTGSREERPHTHRRFIFTQFSHQRENSGRRRRLCSRSLISKANSRVSLRVKRKGLREQRRLTLIRANERRRRIAK